MATQTSDVQANESGGLPRFLFGPVAVLLTGAGRRVEWPAMARAVKLHLGALEPGVDDTRIPQSQRDDKTSAYCSLQRGQYASDQPLSSSPAGWARSSSTRHVVRCGSRAGW
jgi:hypothetical protein